ncbi:MAG: zinc metalloprotease HtpX [Proteobacteria bacterium]|nr:zinc metalloprotease HtpX [Pseudomonadota bacterium]
MPNQIKTVLLLGGLTALIVVLGNLFGGRQGMVVAFGLAVIMNFGTYWFSDKIVLAMYQAREVGPDEDPELHDLIGSLAERAGLPMPRVFVIPQESPNAFATGRNPEHAVVAVTEGLRRMMTREELAGVISHELGHVKNRDILISSIAATMAGVIMILANMARWTAIFGFGGRDDDEDGGGMIGLLFTAILAPIAAMLIQMAISRSREYLADSTGAGFMGRSEPLASALTKLGQASGRLPLEANPATAHMFIVNPLSGRSAMNLFSTHPPLEERIVRLRAMSRSGS